jgi:hypothetical protein
MAHLGQYNARSRRLPQPAVIDDEAGFDIDKTALVIATGLERS